jgi:hypothetical protein
MWNLEYFTSEGIDLEYIYALKFYELALRPFVNIHRYRRPLRTLNSMSWFSWNVLLSNWMRTHRNTALASSAEQIKRPYYEVALMVV